MNLPTDGQWVKFKEPVGDTLVGRAQITYEIPITQPEHFSDYQKDAQRIIRVVKGEPLGDDLQMLPEMGLNAIGLDNLLAALAYEILEK